MSPEERNIRRERLAWMRMDHAIDVDRLSQIYAIREEASAAAREVATRVHEGLLQIKRAEAELQRPPTKPRDTRAGNGARELEPAFPAVNRGAG